MKKKKKESIKNSRNKEAKMKGKKIPNQRNKKKRKKVSVKSI